LEWLDSPVLARVTSSAFNTILDDNCKDNPIMTNKSSSNIKLFYKQRFFNFVIEPLKASFDSQDLKKKGLFF
jgi:hypothetical protein